MYKSIDRADAFRISALTERVEKLRTQQQLLQLQINGHQAEIKHLLQCHGLENHKGLVVTEPGQTYPVGTVLTADGQPVPNSTDPTSLPTR